MTQDPNYSQGNNGVEVSGYGLSGRFWGQGAITNILLGVAIVVIVFLILDRVDRLETQHAAATEQQAAIMHVMSDQHNDIKESLELFAYILTLDQKRRDQLRLQEPVALRRMRQGQLAP